MTFLILAATITVLVVLCLLRVLLFRKERPAAAERSAANIDIFSQRLDELKQELENGRITDTQFRQYRLELETQALNDIGDSAQAEQPDRQNSPLLAAAIILFIPLLSLLIYSHTGNSRFMDGRDTAAGDDAGSQPEHELRQALAALEQEIKDDPDDVEKRNALARVYVGMERYGDAAAVYEELSRLQPEDPDILVNHAEALARAGNNRFAGKPAALLRRALEIAPRHERALWLAGFAELQADNREQALAHWRRLLEGMDSDTALYRQIREMLVETEADSAPSGPVGRGVP